MMPEDVGARSFPLHGGEIKSETNSVSISANNSIMSSYTTTHLDFTASKGTIARRIPGSGNVLIP
jgi:hypothetical protein